MAEFTKGARFVFGPAPCRVLAQLELTYADGWTAAFEAWLKTHDFIRVDAATAP